MATTTSIGCGRRRSSMRFKGNSLAVLLAICLVVLTLVVSAKPSKTHGDPEAAFGRAMSKRSHHHARSVRESPLELARRQNRMVTPICSQPTVRKEWSTLTLAEKRDWQAAFMRLSKPGNSLFVRMRGENGIIKGSVMDDIAVLHLVQNTEFHFNGAFLARHAALINLFNHYMKLAGYDGPEAYLDTLQNPNGHGLSDTQIFDTENLGGDGKGGPIPDGPFKYLSGNVAGSARNASKPIIWHSNITRDFKDSWMRAGAMDSNGSRVGGTFVTTDIVDEIFKHCDYATYRPLIEQLPHGTVHAGIGGTMTLGQSTYEPAFWLLHGCTDWIWRSLQTMCGSFYDYHGPKGQVNWHGKGPGKDGPEVTLDDKIDFLGLTAKIKIRDVMHPQQGINCYRYDKLYIPGQSGNQQNITSPDVKLTTQQTTQQANQQANWPRDQKDDQQKKEEEKANKEAEAKKEEEQKEEERKKVDQQKADEAKEEADKEKEGKVKRSAHHKRHVLRHKQE